jgi:DNA-binding winged helix-turn-helix (wHTH) protein
VGLVDSVVRQAAIADKYLVEVEACQTQKVVYSYEMGISSKSELVPCTGRVQPMACYTLFFTILEPGSQQGMSQPPVVEKSGFLSATSRKVDYVVISISAAMLMLISVFFFRKKKSTQVPVENPDIISIGSYQFDKRNMSLSVNNQTVELTGKEADLLFLLHAKANVTIEREVILNAVWGDEGDYAGRTLDVFISKLRKKLETDESLRIVNIRGVGYKLIVNS